MENRLQQPDISVILLPGTGRGARAKEAVLSILKQTFSNFELLIPTSVLGKEDQLFFREMKDDRILFIEENPDYMLTMRSCARGKYIALTDTESRMASDRLEIQAAILDQNQEIDICSSWVRLFGENTDKLLTKTVCGIIDNPLIIMFLKGFVYTQTVMWRNGFIARCTFQYGGNNPASNLRLWSEAARIGGVFYVDSQPLQLIDISFDQEDLEKGMEQVVLVSQVKNEILQWLIDKYAIAYPDLSGFYTQACRLRQLHLLEDPVFFNLFYDLLNKIANDNK